MELELVIDILKIVLPAGMVVLVAYLILHTFLVNQVKLKNLDLAMSTQVKEIEATDKTLTARFQAYERLLLLLERTTPYQLVSRYNGGNDMTSPEYQLLLINSVRTELEHNVTQQLYVSDETWTVIRTALEELLIAINNIARALPSEATGRDLANGILHYYGQEGIVTPNYIGIRQIKQEAAQFMGTRTSAFS